MPLRGQMLLPEEGLMIDLETTNVLAGGDAEGGTARRRAVTSNAARSSPVSPNASASSLTVFLWGARLTPRSMPPMLRELTFARSASSSCIGPAASR